MTPHLHRLSGFRFFSWFLMISGSADHLPWLSRIPVMATAPGLFILDFIDGSSYFQDQWSNRKRGNWRDPCRCQTRFPWRVSLWIPSTSMISQQNESFHHSYGIYTCVSWRVFIYSILTIRWLRNFHVMGAPWFQDLGVAPNGNIPQIIDFSLSELEQAEYLWATLSKLQTTAEGYPTHSTSPTQWKQHSFPTVPCFWIGSSTSQTSHRESWGSNKIRFEPHSQIARSTIQLGFQHMLIYVEMYWYIV